MTHFYSIPSQTIAHRKPLNPMLFHPLIPREEPSKGENHTEHIPLEGVIATELGSELRFISLESLSCDRRS